jgi:hypothetical protein
VKAKLLVIFALIVTIPLLFTVPIAHASIVGDINLDGHVTILDVVLAASQYMLKSSDPHYNSTIVGRADYNLNGVVDIMDLVTIVKNYGT